MNQNNHDGRRARERHKGGNKRNGKTGAEQKEQARKERERVEAAMRARIERELREELEPKIRAELEHRISTEPKNPVRTKIQSELHALWKRRVSELDKERERIEPAQILKRFTTQAAKLLSKLETSETDTLDREVGKALRQAVLDAMSSRRQHLSHLTKLERVIQENELDQIPRLLEEFFFEAGIKRVDDPVSNPRFFTSVNDDEGKPALEVIEPALIDDVTGRILRSGTVRHVEEG